MILIILLVVAGIAIYLGSFRIGSRLWCHALCRAEGCGRKVAITFDDSNDEQLTPRVLDVLAKHGVEACFFVIGDHASTEILQRMDREGHIVGNHTLHHAGMGPFASTQQMIRDARMCDERIEYAIHRRPNLFRPPFGVTNPMIGRMVRALDYTVVGWSIRSLDTLSEPREKVLERIRRRLHAGAIILLHDNREGVAELTDALLGMLREERYKVVRVDKLLDITAYKHEA